MNRTFPLPASPDPADPSTNKPTALVPEDMLAGKADVAFTWFGKKFFLNDGKVAAAR